MKPIFNILKSNIGAIFTCVLICGISCIGYLNGKNDALNLIKDSRTLTVCFSDDPAGNFGYEIAQAFATSEKMRIKKKIVNNSGEQINKLRNNKCDIIVQPTAIINRKEMNIIHSKAFYTTRLVVLQHKSKQTIDHVNALANDTIVFANNDAISLRLKNLSYETTNIFHIKQNGKIGQSAIIKQICKDTTFVNICPKIEAINYTNIYDSLKIAIPIGFDQEYAWLLQAEEHALNTRLNAFITEFKETKAYRDIFAKHFKLIKQ